MTALAVALAAASVWSAVRTSDPTWAAAAPPAATLTDKQPHVGLVVGVYQAGKPRVLGFGTVTTLTGRAVPDGKTLFEIGSVTKAFTGVLLADAVRRGEVKIDDPANRHLPPDLRLNAHTAGPVTLLHLATHRSGLPPLPPDLLADAFDLDNPYADLTRPRLAASLKALASDAAPGRREEYSNLGAGLVGHALVHVAKEPSFDALVRARIGQPMGLPDTAETLSKAQKYQLAQGFNANRKPTPGWDFGTLEGAGALRSTADDLLRFAAVNLGDGEPRLVESCRDSHTKRRGRVGLFWHHESLPKSKAAAVWHNGGTGGFSSMLVLVPDEKLAVVVLCAAADDGRQVDAVAMGVADALSAGR